MVRENRMKSVGDYFGNDLIDDVAKGDRTIVIERGWGTIFWYQHYENSVESMVHRARSATFLNNAWKIMFDKFIKNEEEIDSPSIKSWTLIFLNQCRTHSNYVVVTGSCSSALSFFEAKLGKACAFCMVSRREVCRGAENRDLKCCTPILAKSLKLEAVLLASSLRDHMVL